ncbi:MAG: ATP-binding cassette domain-containing protein [Planctomycetaceae bacterium]|nr:ATP-binding cassette domain-containing protein [Planctomycetaceae bacterium]
MSGTLAIDAKGIQKTYGTGDAAVTALRGVDLSARFGEMVALVGPSGCGKTTFISILAGLLSRDGGSMQLAGVDPDELNNHQRTLWRRGNVGFIFQQFNLVPQISVLENVAIPLLLRGDSRKDSLER